MDTFEKGRIAENIVADMFKASGWQVFRYGYEHTLPALASLDKKIIGKAADYIRHQPDLIVVNKKQEAFFIEVKFRSNSKLISEDLFAYPNCFVFLLDKNYIYAQSTYYLYKKHADFTNLRNIYHFRDIEHNVIISTINKLRRKLGDETLMGQIGGKLIEKITGKHFAKPKYCGTFVNTDQSDGSRSNNNGAGNNWSKRFYRGRSFQRS